MLIKLPLLIKLLKDLYCRFFHDDLFFLSDREKNLETDKDLPSRGFSEKHIYTNGFIQDVQLIDNNFLWSVPLSTLEMASKCSKLRWIHDPQAGGFTAKFVFYNDVDSFCQDIYHLAICKKAGKADREKFHENCVGAPGESLRSGARKLCFHTSFRYTSPPFELFLSRFCTTTTSKCLISRFMENVNNQRRNLFLFLSLNMSLEIQLQEGSPTIDKVSG